MQIMFNNMIIDLSINGLLGCFKTKNKVITDIVTSEGIPFNIIEEALSIEPNVCAGKRISILEQFILL